MVSAKAQGRLGKRWGWKKKKVTRRFSSSTLTGIVRAEVAVGTSRLACMFSTMRAEIPEGVDARELREALELEADRLVVDVSLMPEL